MPAAIALPALLMFFNMFPRKLSAGRSGVLMCNEEEVIRDERHDKPSAPWNSPPEASKTEKIHILGAKMTSFMPSSA
jgi:hypothetical protein